MISVNLLKSILTLQRTVLAGCFSVQNHSHCSSPSCSEISVTSKKGINELNQKTTPHNKGKLMKIVVSLSKLHFAKPANNKTVIFQVALQSLG